MKPSLGLVALPVALFLAGCTAQQQAAFLNPGGPSGAVISTTTGPVLNDTGVTAAGYARAYPNPRMNALEKQFYNFGTHQFQSSSPIQSVDAFALNYSQGGFPKVQANLENCYLQQNRFYAQNRYIALGPPEVLLDCMEVDYAAFQYDYDVTHIDGYQTKPSGIPYWPYFTPQAETTRLYAEARLALLHRWPEEYRELKAEVGPSVPFFLQMPPGYAMPANLVFSH